jgi:hypothetical protein
MSGTPFFHNTSAEAAPVKVAVSRRVMQFLVLSNTGQFVILFCKSASSWSRQDALIMGSHQKPSTRILE